MAGRGGHGGGHRGVPLSAAHKAAISSSLKARAANGVKAGKPLNRPARLNPIKRQLNASRREKQRRAHGLGTVGANIAKGHIKSYAVQNGKTVRVPHLATGKSSRHPGIATSINPTGARGEPKKQMRLNARPSAIKAAIRKVKAAVRKG
jgi:hypothetical protein